MIGYLNGKLVEKAPTHILLEVNGIGYEVNIPLSTYDKLGQIGSSIKVHTYFHVREDVQRLYGFVTEEERELFRLLISVSGVGPKVALAMLSGSSVEVLKSALANADIAMLTQIPGIGKKTAERVALELKEKIGAVPSLVAGQDRSGKSKEELLLNDALSALVSLGYRPTAAREAVQKALSSILKDDLSVEELIREVLKLV